jgi:hypothetical protein
VQLELALEDVKGLVFSVVDVHRRPVVSGAGHLDEAEAVLALLAVDEDARKVVQEPERLTELRL